MTTRGFDGLPEGTVCSAAVASFEAPADGSGNGPRRGPPGLTPRPQSLIIRALRRSLSRPGRCTLTTEEWQEIRKNTDVRSGSNLRKKSPSQDGAFVSESLILAQDQRWRRA